MDRTEEERKRLEEEMTTQGKERRDMARRAQERRVKGEGGGGMDEGEGNVEVGGTKTTKDTTKPHVFVHLKCLYNLMNAKRLVRIQNFPSN